jgi:hypothetical protein
MKCAKIEVTVNLPEGEDADLTYENVSPTHAWFKAQAAYPSWTSIVLIVVRQ